MQNKKEADFRALGKKELSLAEKINVLSSRCRAQGFYLHELVGISQVTLSKVANEACPATEKVREKLREVGHGFIVDLDFASGPQPGRKARVPKDEEPKAEPKKPEPKKAESKKPAPAPVEDDLDI